MFAALILVLLAVSQSVQGRYIIETQQLDEIIGTHTITDFTYSPFNISGNLPEVIFDEPLMLGDVDRMTIRITGTISPLVVRGDGISRPAEDYIINAGIDHNWSPPYMIRFPSIYDPSGTFLDSDPSFFQEWEYESFLNPLIVLRGITLDTGGIDVVTNHTCDGEGVCIDPINDPILLPLEPDISSIQFVAGPLHDAMGEIPWLDRPWPICPPPPCFITHLELSYCGPSLCIYPLNPSEGLEVVSPLEITITSATITREWNIPEPASLILLCAGAIAVLRRK